MADRNEQAILAYFKTSDAAEKAHQQLRSELNVSEDALQVSSVSAVPGDGIEQVMNPITSNFESHATLVGGADDLSRPGDVGRLLGANPVVYSMSDGDDFVTGYDHLLTAVVPREQVQQALQIIEKHGGKH